MSTLPLDATASTPTDLQGSHAPVAPQIAAPAQRRRWVIAYGLYTIATNATFSQAVWVIYLAAHGYSPFAIGLFEGLFHLVKFLAEVPTGIFADLLGRRASLIVACAIGASASLLYLIPSAPLIALAFGLQGLSYAFKGGADSALLWTLAERSGAADTAVWYGRMFSRMFLLTLAASTLGTTSGGFLAGVTAVLPFLAGGTATALGILPLLLLPERRAGHVAEHRPQALAHLVAGLRAVRRDPVLLGLLLLDALTAGVMTTIGYYTQLFFSTLGFSLAAVGLVVGATIVPAAAFAALAPRVMRRLPMRRLLATFVGMECLGLLGLGSQVPALALAGYVVLLQIGDAILYPAINTYLNERSPEAQRATVLSLDTGLFSAIMIVMFPLFGLGLTHIAFGSAYLWTFAAFTCSAAGALALVRSGTRTR